MYIDSQFLITINSFMEQKKKLASLTAVTDVIHKGLTEDFFFFFNGNTKSGSGAQVFSWNKFYEAKRGGILAKTSWLQAVLLNCSVWMECLLSSILLVGSLGWPGGAEGKACFTPRTGVLEELKGSGGRVLGLAWELCSSK